MMAGLRSVGRWKRTEKFLDNALDAIRLNAAAEYGRKGVEALCAATPKDTGITANSWRYDLHYEGDKIVLTFVNDNIVDGWWNVAIGLQYGHATKNGYWIDGIDYINPALKPIFDEIADSLWKEIISV